MQLGWLQRQLADRDIDARYIRRLELRCGLDNRLWLEVECDAVGVDGGPLPIRTATGGHFASEVHVVPIGGLVLDVGAW